MTPKYVNEWPLDGFDGWVREGRTKLNGIIRSYNMWQVDDCPVDYGQKLTRLITYGIQTLSEVDGGSGWVEELKGMLDFVERKLKEEANAED